MHKRAWLSGSASVANFDHSVPAHKRLRVDESRCRSLLSIVSGLRRSCRKRRCFVTKDKKQNCAQLQVHHALHGLMLDMKTKVQMADVKIEAYGWQLTARAPSTSTSVCDITVWTVPCV